MRIVFALIAHGETPPVIRLISTLLKSGHRVVVHYDGKQSASDFRCLQAAFRDASKVLFAERTRVAWAEWSVVQATLNCLESIEAAAWQPDYVYLLSGSDYPIRPWRELVSFLERNKGDEFIESVPSDTTKWVKSGPQEERYQYRWFTNWRESPFLTDRILALQKLVGLKRRFVRNFVPHLGSQWWVLTWQTLKKVLLLSREPDIRAFFKRTLVPDELFFQTLVRTIVPNQQIIGCSLTLYQFTDYGYPVVYHFDHVDYILRQRFFMARKLSLRDSRLRERLDEFWEGKSGALLFRDENVGIRTSEYEDWRLAHRTGVPNAPLIAAPDQSWATASRRTTKVVICIVGTSLADLHFLQSLVGGTQNIIMHGELFNAKKINFVNGANEFAGYGVNDVQLRDSAKAEFFLDVIRAAKDHTSGFILRAGQGGAFAESLMQQPNIKTIFLNGDPIIAFSESLYGQYSITEDVSLIAEAGSVTPEAAANRFRIFLREHRQHLKEIDRHFETARKSKPKNWAIHLDFFGGRMERLAGLIASLGLDLDISAVSFALSQADFATASEQRRQNAKELLMRGGIDPAVFDVLKQEPGNPDLALNFV